MDNPVIETHIDYPDRSLFIWPKQGYWLIADKDFWKDFSCTINSNCNLTKEYKTIIKEFSLRGIIKDQKQTKIKYKEIPLFFNPTKLVISLTDNCNLKCPYCYANSTPDNNNFISKKSIINVLSFISRFNDNKEFPYSTKVSFVGGEPFLHVDIIDILNNAYNKGFITSITTNGTIKVPDSIILILLKTHTEVNISIDGHCKEIHSLTRTSSFEKVINLSENLINQGVPVSVTTVIHKGNFPYLEEIIEFFYDKGFQGISLNTINQMGRGRGFENRILKSKLYSALFNICISKPHLKEFLKPAAFYLFIYKISKSLTQKDCGLSNKSFFLNQDGKLYICGALKEPEFDLPYTAEVDLIKNTHLFCDNITQKYNVEQILNCTNCNYKYFCAGDCRGEANDVFKNKLEIHPDCEDIKLLYKDMMFKLSEYPNFLD
jgi:mycofactocin biosynthetic radical S-adenosylmethionine protein MftC